MITDFTSGSDKLVFECFHSPALTNVGGDFWQLTYTGGVDGQETFEIVGVLAGGLAPGDVQFI